MPKTNKIESELSAEELIEFVRRCQSMPNLTGDAISKLAAEYGIYAAPTGAALTFKNTTFKRHLQSIRKTQELAMEVAAIQEAGTGNTLADAAAALISREVYQELAEGIDDNGRIDLDTASKIVSRVRMGDQRSQLLEAKLKEFEAKEEERAAKKKELEDRVKRSKNRNKGLSKEAMAMIEEAIGLL